MRLAVDRKKVEALMRAQGLNVSEMVAASGLSRQGYYDMFKEEYQPVAKGVVALAGVLGMNPVELLEGVDESARALRAMLDRAADGDARSFEVLPGTLLSSGVEGAWASALTATKRRLLSAAAQVVYFVIGQPLYRSLADVCMPDDGGAFFFGRRYMPVEQVIARTPAPLKERGVYGVFALEDFERHLA